MTLVRFDHLYHSYISPENTPVYPNLCQSCPITWFVFLSLVVFFIVFWFDTTLLAQTLHIKTYSPTCGILKPQVGYLKAITVRKRYQQSSPSPKIADHILLFAKNTVISAFFLVRTAYNRIPFALYFDVFST